MLSFIMQGRLHRRAPPAHGPIPAMDKQQPLMFKRSWRDAAVKGVCLGALRLEHRWTAKRDNQPIISELSLLHESPYRLRTSVPGPVAEHYPSELRQIQQSFPATGRAAERRSSIGP